MFRKKGDMRVTWISFVLLALTARAPAQLNQYDAQHKKHGPWVVYLNSWWKEVSDSTRATYRKYTWYDHGENLYPMGPRDKHWKLVHKDSSDSDSSRIKLLNGSYTWIDKKGVTRGIDVFSKGQYVLMVLPFGQAEPGIRLHKKMERPGAQLARKRVRPARTGETLCYAKGTARLAVLSHFSGGRSVEREIKNPMRLRMGKKIIF